MSMSRNREMSLETNSCKLSSASIFAVLVSKETLYPKVSRYGGAAPASCDKPEGIMI